jgi:hypothetical protein
LLAVIAKCLCDALQRRDLGRAVEGDQLSGRAPRGFAELLNVSRQIFHRGRL